METTAGLLARTAQRMVAEIAPVGAVVLFGSRARGTAHAESDWDVAVLVDCEPDLSVWNAVPTLEHVNVVCKNQKDFRERALHVGSLESAIVRDGQVLAGTWERPDQTGEWFVDNELIRVHLKTASSGVMEAMHQACFVLGGDNDALRGASRHTQSAAEFTSKAAMMHLGIDPEHVHDLIDLANQIEREGPGDSRAAEWAAKVRSMNGLSRKRHTRVYAPNPLELLERPFAIVSTVTEFFAVVLRDIVETRENFAPHAAEVAAAVQRQSLAMCANPDWSLIPASMRSHLDTWAEEVQSIGRLVQTRTQRTAWGMGSPDASEGTGL